MPENKLIYGGLDIPLIDFFAPSREDYQHGIPDIKQSRGGGEQALHRVDVALHELDYLNNYTKDMPKGAKVKIKDEDLSRIEECFLNLRLAARGINNIRAEMRSRGVTTLPEVHIRRAGGTIANKLHTLKFGLGNKIEARLFGPIGENDEVGNKTFQLKHLKDSHIELYPKKLFLPDAGHSFIIIENGDRKILKTPAPKLKKLLQGREAEITSFIKGCDVVLIEASSVSEVKFGFQIFELMANAAMKNGKKIFFSPPTDADQLYPKVKKDISEERARITRNRAIFNEIINYKHTEVISMNETELVMMFGEYDAARGNLTVNSPDDKNFTQALNNLQAILKKKLTSINPANPEPVAFVSFGKLGAYAITASQCVFVPALEIKNIIDTTGAGDAFASGCIIKQNEIISSTLTFSESHLKEMLTHGETLANKVIAQYGAQLIQAQ